MTTAFDLGFVVEVLPALLAGLILTAQVTAWAFVIALLLGYLAFLARRSRSRPLASSSRFAIEFIRSTPLLVQLYFAYFVLPQAGIDLSPVVAGSMVLGVHYSCYTAEVFRTALQSVPAGQFQSADALGLTPVQRMRLVVLPQMVPLIIPGVGNALIALVKDTPALSAISAMEMLSTAKIVGSETFRYLEPMTVCGLTYLVISLALAGVIHSLRSRLGWTAARR